MKKTFKKVVFVLTLAAIAVLFAVSALALTDYKSTTFATNYFYGDTNKDPMTYDVGETMTFTVSLKSASGDLVSVPFFSYAFTGDDGVSLNGRVSGTNGTFTVNHKITCPGFVRLTVKPLDADGNVITGTDSSGASVNIVFNGGACAEWEKIETAMAEPDDFDEYWERCLSELYSVDPTIYDLKIDTVNSNNKYTVYDLYVNAPGSKLFLNTAAAGEEPNGATYMAGKLTVPTNLDPGTAKFYLTFQGAGVYTSPGISKKADHVTLCVYAHSIELSREDDYYTTLNNGLLSGYMKRALYNDNADVSYTKYMILRDLQAVRFLKTFFGSEGGGLTEFNGIDISAWKGLWNGKDIDIYGQSQGGFQCIAVAALDHDITLCRPWVPCWCDMYAKTYFPTRRTMGLVYEHYSQKYFDSVALGKRIVCRTEVNTGFGDDTCPTTGVITAYNAMTCEKVLNIYQGMPHNCSTNYASGVAKQKYTSGEENFKLPYSWDFTFDWEIASVSDPSVLQILPDGKTVKALKKGTATVNFVDSNRDPILVEVETAVQDLIMTDGSLDDLIAEGMIKSIYTRTVNTAYVADSWNDFSADLNAGNIEKGISYYVITDFDGDLTYTAAQMYALYTASGADCLVLIPGSELTSTTAAMYAMQTQPNKYPNAYVVDTGSSDDAYQTGRNAGNNIVSIIEENKPVTNADFKVYDAFTGNEIKALSVLPEGSKYSVVVILNQPFNVINGVSVSAVGLELDRETLTVTGDADGGIIVVNGAEYTVYGDAVDSGIEDGYSWVLDSDGKLTVLSDGEISDDSYPWASYASSIKEIEVSVGVTNIASGAFAGVNALEMITLPYTLVEIASDAVTGAASYTVCGYENNSASTEFATATGMTFSSLGACGAAGESLMWEYKDNVLYITGNGTTIVSGVTGYNGQAKSSWYDYYPDIKKVVICDSVTTIGVYAFHNMKALTTVEVTKNLTTISNAAFENSSAFNCIYVKGDEPISGTLDLSYVTTFSGSYQFDGCSKVANIILSENLKSGIPDKFISYNSVLTSLTIPASVPSIHKRALYKDSALKELTVLGTGTTLPEDMLTYDNNTTKLTTIYGRSGSPAHTFAVNNSIEFVDITGDQYDGEILISGECGEDVYFKMIENETAGTYTLYFYGSGTTIVSGCTEEGCAAAPWASYADGITNVIFRGGIDSIGAYTLSGLYNLESIALEGCDFTNICANAFTGSGISGAFEIPVEVTAIDANAFAGLSDLTSVVIHNDAIVIDENAFVDCGLTTVYGFYKSTAETFAENAGLTFININDYLPVAVGYLYGEWNGSPTVNTKWTYDKATKTLTFASLMSGWNETGRTSMAKDGKGWTDYINEVETVVVGSGLNKVTQYAFKNHTALKTIELSTSIGQIDVQAFYGCTSLDTIYIKGYTPIEGLADLHGISTIDTQSGVFVNCAFDTVILNSSETTVKDDTFTGTPLKTIIGNTDNTAAVAETLGVTAITGYAYKNTIWKIDDGVLTVYTNGTPEAISDLENYYDTVTKIVFESESDIIALNTGVFDGFTNLSEVLFKCDAPHEAQSGCFGANNVTVYYAKGITTFTTPNWNGYTCLEEGSTLGIIDSGLCIDGGYVWSLDELGTLTISGTGNGVLEFTKTPNWNALGNIAWYSYLSDIKKVIIEEETQITKIVPYGLSNMRNCTTIIIPTTLTDLSSYNVLSVLHRLNTIAVQGNEVVEGVIDLRNVTKFNSQLFEQSFNYTTPTIYLPANPDTLNITKWAEKCSELTFMTYPTCTSATLIRNLAEMQSSSTPNSKLPAKITLKYYPVEIDASLARSGSQTQKNGVFDWVFDDETGTLTFTKGATVTGWNELLYNGKSTELINWKSIWKDAVVHIEVGSFSKLQFNGYYSIFANMVNLETVKFTNASLEWQCSTTSEGIFEGCTSLTTLGFGSSYTEGIIDLSCINKYAGASHKSMFKNCASITNVKFRETLPSAASETVTYHSMITNSFFSGCTSLKSIEIPGWVTNIDANAFDGCTSLVSVTLNSLPSFADSSVFPDNENQNLLIYCPDQATADAVTALGYTYTKPVYFGNLAAAVTMDGYAVRLEKYNGLRGLFTFDNSIKETNASNGYTLVEYGAILTSAAAYNSYGKELTLSDGKYVTANSLVKKLPVFEGETQVGKILSTSNDDYVYFVASIVKYSNNFKSDVYMGAYEIWRTSAGSEVVIYTDCSNDDYDFTNLYEISLNLYKNGLVNAENDVEGIVWKVLEENGVVTLTAGTDYTFTEGQTDLDGNSLAESFKFLNVPAVNQKNNSTDKTITFTKTNTTITLLEDGDNFVAVYRGTGAIPYTNAWGNAGSSQLLAGFCSDYSMTVLPNPKMAAATSTKIKTVVLDYGITEIANAAFAGMTSLEKLIYPTSVISSKGSTFVSCKSLTTVYCADINNSDFVPKTNIVDLSHLNSVAVNYLFTSCSKIQYVHLPANIGANGSGMLNNCAGIKALWCGDAEMVEGTADYSLTSVTTFGDYAFTNASKISTLKLPATAEKFFDMSGSTERHAFKNSGIETIVTETEVAAITEYIATYGETYSLTYSFGTDTAE